MIFFIPLSQDSATIIVLDNDSIVPSCRAPYSLCVIWKFKSAAGQVYIIMHGQGHSLRTLACGPWKAGMGDTVGGAGGGEILVSDLLAPATDLPGF